MCTAGVELMVSTSIEDSSPRWPTGEKRSTPVPRPGQRVHSSIQPPIASREGGEGGGDHAQHLGTSSFVPFVKCLPSLLHPSRRGTAWRRRRIQPGAPYIYFPGEQTHRLSRGAAEDDSDGGGSFATRCTCPQTDKSWISDLRYNRQVTRINARGWEAALQLPPPPHFLCLGSRF